MNRFAKTCTAAVAAGLLLSACNTGADASDDGSDAAAENPVYAAMSAWNVCEILGNLQPITDEMAIEGWGGTNAEGGEPGPSELGNTFDPDAMGCGSLLNITSGGDYVNFGGGGELKVKLVPTESADQAASAYEERAAAAQSSGSGGEGLVELPLEGGWDQGVLYGWTGSANAHYLEVIGQSGQWVLHIQLNYDHNFGEEDGEPAYSFTSDELEEWFAGTYAAEVEQTVNAKIAEVQ
ncbi:hypothetical protein [Glycomyces artemisiae]|uniref:Lipoprotein n=1 Tax=Glycomyces artemisiae TaxID=1076443 RepID=A0A2T0UM60_9ACTN|nr:hypothetical protein [Glycomyces artemisiae]PRY58984.1 hypothetical protein B0I28_104139 [Glycomyces artemisiae]